MFCSNCGTKLPDNARFCSSCGQKIGDAVSPQQTADDFLKQLSPEQQEDVFRDLAEATMTAMGATPEGIDILVRHAKEGGVTTDDVLTARGILANSKAISGNIPTSENNVLFVYQDAFFAYETYRQYWGKTTKENRDRLVEDLAAFAHNGLQGLFTRTAVIEKASQSRILAHPGIVQYLEEVLVSSLLLEMKFTGVELSAQGTEMLIKGKGKEFVEKVLQNMQKAFNHYIAEVQGQK